MVYFIWSILNITIVLFFLFLIFGFIRKGKKIFNPKLKTVSIIVMIVGIVQIISAANSDEKKNLITHNKGYNNSSYSKLKEIKLEDNLTFDINMHLRYSVDNDDFVLIESNSFLTGFVSGYSWKHTSFQANNYMLDEKQEFTAEGILKWNLFGINVYNQSKRFTGIIK